MVSDRYAPIPSFNRKVCPYICSSVIDLFNSVSMKSSLYSDRQRNINLSSAPSLPLHSLAPITSSHSAGPSTKRETTSRPSATPRPRIPPSEEFKTNTFFKELCSVKPGSLEAQDLLYAVTEGASPLFTTVDEKKQMSLLYEAFRHIFCRSLSECLVILNIFIITNVSYYPQGHSKRKGENHALPSTQYSLLACFLKARIMSVAVFLAILLECDGPLLQQTCLLLILGKYGRMSSGKHKGSGILEPLR